MMIIACNRNKTLNTCNTKRGRTSPGGKRCYLSVDLVGLLSSAAQQVPPFVLDITNVHVVPVVFTEWNPSAAKHQQVVAMQDS